jgi:DNA-binding Xre family transcriptional regulator
MARGFLRLAYPYASFLVLSSIIFIFFQITLDLKVFYDSVGQKERRLSLNNFFEGLDTSGKLRLLMAAKNMSASDLAKLLDCTRETINHRFEANRWRVNDLQKIAVVLEVKPQDLI